MIKPKMLKQGDTIAVVSPSWGGPAVVPQRYLSGKRQLEQAFGVHVVEMPHAMSDPKWLADNPKARADDLMQAFSDPGIHAIIASIGGDDSIRLLPYIDLGIIHDHPKVFMGYSDTTVEHLACFTAGIVSFYGPSIMAGFAENGGIFPYMLNSVRKTIFSSEPIGRVEPNRAGWTVEHLDWAVPENQYRKRRLNPSEGWHYLQGDGAVTGRLIGGCLDVLDWLRGTPVWPGPETWQDSILFLETSEDAPPPQNVVWMLRALAAMGVLEQISGLLFGRPGGQLPMEQYAKYDEAVLQVVDHELGLKGLPVITNMDFGHTDPMLVLPYGVIAGIDCDKQEFTILESAVVE